MNTTRRTFVKLFGAAITASAVPIANSKPETKPPKTLVYQGATTGRSSASGTPGMVLRRFYVQTARGTYIVCKQGLSNAAVIAVLPKILLYKALLVIDLDSGTVVKRRFNGNAGLFPSTYNQEQLDNLLSLGNYTVVDREYVGRYYQRHNARSLWAPFALWAASA